MEQISRRKFIKGASAATLAAACGLYSLPAQADYAQMLYTLHGNGWGRYQRREIISAAMDLVGVISYDSVLEHAYELSRGNYYLAGGTWDRTNPNAYYNSLGYEDVMYAQLMNLDGNLIPKINIYPYYEQNNSWGKAYDDDIVAVEFFSNGYTIHGEFKIYLNFYQLGSAGDGSSPATWAGIIAHEMLHNLGHKHDINDYRSNLQINALQQAVYLRAGGLEHIVAARHFPCGCYV